MRTLLVLIVLIAANGAFAEGLPNGVPGDFIQLCAKGNYLGAASCFYYPVSETGTALASDRGGVKALLKTIVTTIGRPSDESLIKGPAQKYYKLSLTGANSEFWGKHPNVVQYFYSVNYKKYGKGVIVYNFASVGGKYVLKGVDFGLFASRPGVKKMMIKLGGAVMETARQLLLAHQG